MEKDEIHLFRSCCVILKMIRPEFPGKFYRNDYKYHKNEKAKFMFIDIGGID
jgi:hypothetical protein